MTKRTEPAPATTGEAAHDPGVVLPDGARIWKAKPAPAVTGEASSPPATASKGGLPTVSGIGVVEARSRARLCDSRG